MPAMQVSFVHSLPSSHTLGSPVQFAPEHVSFTVQSFPSLQAPVWFVCWQTPFEQVSMVQNLPSSQLSQAPPLRPQFCGELTKQSGPEMHPVQQPVPMTQTPPVQEAPAANTHLPPPSHVPHSPQSLQEEPSCPQRLSVCSVYPRQ
jgi:hypothetical protein